MNTCTTAHDIASSAVLPFDGGHAGPAAGGSMRQLWCRRCTWACKDYSSAGFTTRVYCTHPRVIAERHAEAKRALVAALPPVQCFDRGVVRGTIRVLDVTGVDATSQILIRDIVVESTWGGRQQISRDAAMETMAAHIPGISAMYAEILRLAETIASKSWAR